MYKCKCKNLVFFTKTKSCKIFLRILTLLLKVLKEEIIGPNKPNILFIASRLLISHDTLREKFSQKS